MAYSDFKTIAQVQEKFGLDVDPSQTLFEAVESVEVSDFLQQTIQRNLFVANAVNTEKARSELLIAPILLEVRELLQEQVSFFSGTEFNVDSEAGLTGFCDFMLTASPEVYEIRCPVVTIVEAKNESIKTGLGQCIASMVAAQRFNSAHADARSIYGVVSTGVIWKFLKLEQNFVWIDREDYLIKELVKLLGILALPFRENN